MRLEKIQKLLYTLISIILIIFIIKFLKIIPIIKRIITILMPLFIGFTYAWFINPLIKKISQKYPRHITAIMSFLIIIISFSLLLYFIIPIIYQELSEVIKILPEIFNNIENKINNMGLNDYLDKVLTFLIDEGPNYLLKTIKDIFRYLGIIGIGLILGLYISIDYPTIINKMINYIPKKYKCFLTNLVIEMSTEVRKCIYGTLLIAFFVFLADSILFFIIKLDAPLIFGLLCGLTDLIPYIGPYIGGIIAIAVGFTRGKITGYLCIIICLIVQTIENYCLQPIIMSKTIKISPVLIIIGLLLFGNIFGVVGLLIATPCVAILKIFIENINYVLKKCK